LAGRDARYRHLINRKFVVLETLSWWSKSGKVRIAYGSVHRAFRASMNTEIFPIFGATRSDEFDSRIGGVIRAVPSLWVTEAELWLHHRARTANQVETFAELVTGKILLEVTTDLLQPLLSGEKDKIYFNVQFHDGRQASNIPVVISAIPLVDERFKTAVKTALDRFGHSAYPQLPVLVVSVAGSEKRPVGFYSQLAVGGYLLSRGLVEQVRVPFNIDFEDFDVLVPVVEMPGEMANALAINTTVNTLPVYMNRYGVWFEMLFSEALGTDEGLEII